MAEPASSRQPRLPATASHAKMVLMLLHAVAHLRETRALPAQQRAGAAVPGTRSAC
jgi:hypothetical protein